MKRPRRGAGRERGEEQMKYPKLVIISDGKRVAALLNGMFYGKGIGRFSMDATKRNAPELTLEVDKIDAGAFHGDDVSAFERFWSELTKE